ncbi:hypothetical protein [Krasilnikovia sp. M28-CT-15]|uniref:hypothetical protein n=1 Tax=Krasilnikovia sp. M28-CT-15 TaxID=3373540 RepID=UPI0038763195
MRIWGLALLVTLGGCAAAGEPAAPAATHSRAVAPVDCGTFVLRQVDEPGSRLPAAAPQCLAEAVRTRQPARLKLTRPTDEGDPIHETYESDATGRVRVTLDTRDDNFGPRAVTTKICTGMAIDREWFEFHKCDPGVAGPGYVDTHWRLTAVTDGRGTTKIPASVDAWLELTVDGEFHAADSVNAISGKFGTTSVGFDVTDTVSSAAGYIGNDPVQLAAIAGVGALDHVTVVSADREHLTVQAGGARLTFVRDGPASR